MIAAGLASGAQQAVEELNEALEAAQLSLPGVCLSPRVWDSVQCGPVKLVELGCVPPETAAHLAPSPRTRARRGDATVNEPGVDTRKNAIAARQLRAETDELNRRVAALRAAVRAHLEGLRDRACVSEPPLAPLLQADRLEATSQRDER